jgi:hypothetical protein
MLHVRCGSDIFDRLEAAGLPGEFLAWDDPLCQGPCPAGLSRDEWRPLRADYLARTYRLPRADAEARLVDQDARLERSRDHEEVVLWFEHDLYDQPILLYLLRWFGRQSRGPALLSLICIGEHPAVPRFTGLGNLDAFQLADLFPTRRPVTPQQMAEAEAAWTAYTSADPQRMETVAKGHSDSLPFVANAFLRQLQEFPWTGDGLSLTERTGLEAVRDGAASPSEAFRLLQARERHPFLGDAMFFAALREMAEGPAPLLFAEGEWPGLADSAPEPRLRLTAAGREVLAGAEDRLRLSALDRWIGGVHLSGHGPEWRWDPAARAVVRSRAPTPPPG